MAFKLVGINYLAIIFMMSSLTLVTKTEPADCVNSCMGMENGSYQYCRDCRQYVICQNGYKYVLPCPFHFVWNDVRKMCDWNSPTCSWKTPVPKHNFTENTKHARLNPCVDSCLGLNDGNYQDCQDCNHYVSCSNYYMYIMPCPSQLVWDDVLKRCEWTSSSCSSTKPGLAWYLKQKVKSWTVWKLSSSLVVIAMFH